MLSLLLAVPSCIYSFWHGTPLYHTILTLCVHRVEKLGYPVPVFDFRLPGVTSMSADIHKYGMGIKVHIPYRFCLHSMSVSDRVPV